MIDILVMDSSALIALFGGEAEVARNMAKAVQVLVPAIVCGEINAGTQGNSKREVAEREAFKAILETPGVSVIPATRKTGEFYAKVFTYAKAQGKPIPTNDIWVAAAALETGGMLYTNDKHLLSLPLIRTMKCAN